jgi:hypothetical protein
MKIERGNTHDLGFYDIGGETKNVLEENWDYLIILDAGRFDFFNDLYRNHLNGNLKKAISPATTTMMWLNKVFTDFYEDIVYVSANPYINSRIAVTDQYGLKFEGKKHFFKVVDVWKFGWDERLGTVHPNSVNDAIFKIKENYKNKRFVLHYMQPHEPYISTDYIRYIKEDYIKRREETNRSINVKTQAPLRKAIRKIRTSAGKAITKSFGIEVTWKIINLVDGSPVSQPISIYIEEGMKGLRKAYRENLGLVLESVAELLENVSGNILITADHGEYLGENRRYGHGLVPRHPPIIEVPWLIIEGNRPKRKKIIEREIIKERIERLKKMGKT